MKIALHIIPKSSKNEIVGWTELEGRPVLRIKVAAPPQDGKANRELLKFLSKYWKVPVSSLELAKGAQSRHKQLIIHDETLASRLRGGGF